MKKPPSKSNGGEHSSINGSGNHDEAASAGTVECAPVAAVSRRTRLSPIMLAGLSRAAWIAIGIMFAAAWFATLDVRKLQHPDEGRYAEIAREMVATGDWVTPRLNGLKYFEKPPLQYWLTAAAFSAFGIDEWTVRLPPALATVLALLAIGYAGKRIASSTVGAYAALAFGGMLWPIGIAHIVTLDALLTAWLGAALAAFLIAQCGVENSRDERRWMLLAWAAVAGATLVKGPVAVVIPGGALALYSLMTRDFAVWKRLHLAGGLAVFLALSAPWFIAVSLKNPEFARFFFIHEHLDRYLTTEHRRTGAIWYFVPLLLVGLIPWTGVFLSTAWRAWRDAPRASTGFSWPRFCLAWTAFVFCFFSVSGSKLPSYILPLFPGAALLIAWQLERLPQRLLYNWTIAAVATAAVALIVTLLGYNAIAARLADARTPLSIYRQFEPWLIVALVVAVAGSVAALFAFARDSAAGRTVGIVIVTLVTLTATQVAFVGDDAFRTTRSAADVVTALERSAPPYDPSAPFYQVETYDQTLPFYLKRTTTLVDYRDEFALGLDAEPERGVAKLPDWEARWRALPQAYALMTPDTFEKVEATGLPMRVVARDPRRVLVARQ
jgi:4-amino-4-deoxy-L-arabinose transferase-like glycosyltransferase